MNTGENIKIERVPLWQRIVPRVLESIAWYPTRILLRVFLRMKVNKYFKITKEEVDRPILFISNHISELDPILTTMATSPFNTIFPLFWVSKAGREYKDPDFSWRKYIYGDLFFLAWGAQPLTSKVKNYEMSLKRHSWLLKHGYSVCIFPERGYSNKSRGIGGGAGFLMEAWNPLVIPVKIEGIEGITQREFWGRRRGLRVTFGKALEPKDYLDSNLPAPERYKDAIKKIFKTIDYEIN